MYGHVVLVFRAAFCVGGVVARGAVRGPTASPFGVSAWLARPFAARALCRASSAEAAGGAGGDDDDLDGPAPPWASLGMAAQLLDAVGQLKHELPTPIQARAFAAIRAPDAADVVIAGETGIGKTLAYLLPAIDALLAERGEAGERDENAGDGGAATALVLQPNADLAYQAAAAAEQLVAGTGLTVVNLHAAHDERDARRCSVLIGTPPRVLEVANLERARFVVLDEADSLLSGSFKTGARQKYPIEQLLLALRQEVRARATDAKADGLEEGAALRLQHVLVGATVPAHGTRNVRARVQQLFPNAVWVQSAGLHATVRALEIQFVNVGGAQTPSREDALAAAMREATADSAAEAAGAEPTGGQVLVFANTLPGVERALAVLDRLGVPAAPFHKKVPVVERRQTLGEFARGELRALVSTGLAARGLDLPRVEHVIEFEFAQNVVEHLHRVGRTARARREGRATCLIGPDDADLARAIQAGLDAGTGIESAVSRNRSFRNRIKRARANEAAYEAERSGGGGVDDEDDGIEIVEQPGRVW